MQFYSIIKLYMNQAKKHTIMEEKIICGPVEREDTQELC